MSERKSGILLHISSLPSEYGVGDLGPEAYRFVDVLHQSKQHYWQILPVNPTDEASGHSPYSSLSAFAGSTLFISPQLLVDDGILRQEDITVTQPFSAGIVEYEKAAAYKKEILTRAYDHFISDASVRRANRKAFRDFASANAFWLDDYALFITIKEYSHGKPWTDWPEALRDRDRTALRDFASVHQDKIDRVKFCQYVFYSQWTRLKKYCEQRDVRLFGDIAIYMNLDSADVWQHPKNYKLDAQCRPKVVAGVPPDYFSKTGQRWGNPTYDWAVLEANGFSWWVDRIRFNFTLFDVVRIDHFRGLVQCWEIPAEEETAVNGEWADVPTDDFFKALQDRFPGPLAIIAEDLGYITDDVRAAMRRLGFPGMKILLFAFNGDLITHPYLPHNFIERCVVYTGTHDNNTVRGWFKSEASEQEVRNVEEYIGRPVSDETIHWDLVEMAFTSNAELAIIPLQDILGLGGEGRMNTPSTTGGANWRWRFSKDLLTDALIQKLSDLTVRTGRH
ncbi:MAG TPA: 4-alpha-glucanotransferase [Candidatus Omnitrophota bacterium]|nr:4-alpha-glucanotransferase [Candidatus Omnitrophota bacterium]